VALDLHLSRVRTGVAAMGQGCNYQLDTTELGRKRKGKKKLCVCIYLFKKNIYILYLVGRIEAPGRQPWLQVKLFTSQM
jgi:hypothetical protein